MNIAASLEDNFNHNFKLFAVVPKLKIPVKDCNWQKAEFVYGDLDSAQRSGCFNKNTNIGINCGMSGIVVVDCDVKDGKNGVDNWLSICRQINHDPNSTKVVKSPSGGFHYYYRNIANHSITSVTDCLDIGVDIKADGGYVLGAGSVLRNDTKKNQVAGVYEKANNNKPIELPESLAQLILEKQNPKRLNGKPSEDYKKKPFTQEDKGDFENALANISSNCDYTAWGSIILSGRDLVINSGWDEKYVKDKLMDWSKQSTKHDWATAEKSFNGWWNSSQRDTDNKCITYKTLFNIYNREIEKEAEKDYRIPTDEEFEYEASKEKEAKLLGEQAPHEKQKQPHEVTETSQEEDDSKLANKVYAAIVKGFWLFIDKKYYLIAKDDWNAYRDFKFENPQMYFEKKDMELTVTRYLKKHYKFKPFPAQKTISKQITRFLQNAPEKRQFEYLFGKETDKHTLNIAPTKFATEYTGGWKRQEDFECPDFDYFIEKVISAGDKGKYEWMMDCLADIYQNPNTRSGVFVILLSEEQGTGKGTFFDLLMALFGEIAYETDTLDSIVGKYNDPLLRSTIICLDEINLHFEKKQAERVKHLITAPKLVVRPMYCKERRIKNVCRVFLASNDNSIKQTSITDRRDVYFRVSPIHANQKKEYFDPLRKLIEAPSSSPLSHQRKEFMGKLKHRDISNKTLTDRSLDVEHDNQKISSLKTEGIEKLVFQMADEGMYPSPLDNKGWKQVHYPVNGGFIPSEVFKRILSDHKDFNKKYVHDPISPAAIKKYLTQTLGCFKAKHKSTQRGFICPPIEVLREVLYKRFNLVKYQWTELVKDLIEMQKEIDDGSDT